MSRKWRNLVRKSTAASRASVTSGERLDAFERRYVEEHPLAADVLALLAAALREGYPLCCYDRPGSVVFHRMNVTTGGKSPIDEHVSDPVWRALLDRWAYERAGCGDLLRPYITSGGITYGEEYARKLERDHRDGNLFISQL